MCLAFGADTGSRWCLPASSGSVACSSQVATARQAGNGPPAVSAADLAASAATIDRMQLPSDFVRVTGFGPATPCAGDRCYLVPRSTKAVAALVPAILQRVATYEPKDTFCTSVHPRGHGTLLTCQFAAIVKGNVGILALVDPYLACSVSRHCRLTDESELLFDRS
jgi:hypothetical protein